MNSVELAERTVLCNLFRAFPGQFVWIGGSVLQIVYRSPRFSYDIDLSPTVATTDPAELAPVIAEALDQLNLATGHSYILESSSRRNRFARFHVTEEGTFRFTVDDVTRIAGSVGETKTIVLDSLSGPQAVVIPDASALLLLKIEAVLFRRRLKASDVFDLWFLLSSSIRLNRQQRIWLGDRLRAEEVSLDDVENLFRGLSVDRFLASLRRGFSEEQIVHWDERKAQHALDRVLRFLRRQVPWQ